MISVESHLVGLSAKSNPYSPQSKQKAPLLRAGLFYLRDLEALAKYFETSKKPFRSSKGLSCTGDDCIVEPD